MYMAAPANVHQVRAHDSSVDTVGSMVAELDQARQSLQRSIKESKVHLDVVQS